jgi:Zn-dependent protease
MAAICPFFGALVGYFKRAKLSTNRRFATAVPSQLPCRATARPFYLLLILAREVMLGCSVQRWSISLGRWAGIQVRIHIFFITFAALAIVFSTLPDLDLLGDGLVTLAVALGSVILHEAAHALAAIRVGGKVDTIVLGPVGGLVSPRVPDEPETQLAVAMAGPIVHLALVVIAAGSLAIAGYGNIQGLLHPLDPSELVEGSSWLVFGKLTLWLNWVLLLLNLLPAYPFDGAPILRSMLWPAIGRRSARIVTGRAGMVVALLICACAFLPITGDVDSIIVIRFSLIMLGIFLFFSARQDLASSSHEELFDDATGYNVSGDGLDLLDAMIAGEEDDDDAVLVEHGRRPSESREHDRRAQEAYEDARVDDILARLHDTSLNDLSREELEVLQRASQRYKRRHGASGNQVRR